MKLSEEILLSILSNIRKGFRPTAVGWRITEDQYDRIVKAIEVNIDEDSSVWKDEAWDSYRMAWRVRVIQGDGDE